VWKRNRKDEGRVYASSDGRHKKVQLRPRRNKEAVKKKKMHAREGDGGGKNQTY